MSTELDLPLLSGSDLSRSTDLVTDTLVSDSQDSEFESEEEEDDVEVMKRMKELLMKAKLSARANELKKLNQDGLKDNEAIVLFDEEEEEEEEIAESSKSTSTKSLIPPSLVRPISLQAPTSASILSRLDKGKGKETGITLAQDLGNSISSTDKWGTAPKPQLSKKERKANIVPNAGPKWFNMPSQVLTPELKREVQAMRLRNALDPKRFYKGGAKDSKTLPEFFQFGHILPSTTSASNAVQSIARKRTFVEELISDEQAKAYTKKKFVNEVMVRGMSGRKQRGGKGTREKGKGSSRKS